MVGSKSLRLVLLLAALWLCLSYAASPFRPLGVTAFPAQLAAIALFVVATQLLFSAQRGFIVALSISAALISLITVAQYLGQLDLFAMFGTSSAQTGRMRVFSTLGNPDFTGAFLAACLPAICSLPQRARRFGVLSLALVAIYCTGSRASILAAAIGLGTWLILQSKSSLQRKLVILGALGIVLVASLVLVSRWNGRSVETSMQGRLTIWRVALHHAAWSGYGPGSFAYVYLPKVGDAMRDGVRVDPRFISAERHAENDLVEVIVETGYIGAIIAIAVLGIWFREALRRRGPVTSLSIATVASLLCSSMFDFTLHRGETMALMAVAMALPFAQEPSPTSPFKGKRLYIAGPLAAVALAAAALPIYSSRLTRRAALAESAGEFRDAATLYRRAAVFCPDNTDAWFGASRAFARAEDYNEALFWSAQATRFIAEPELWVLRARIFESVNKKDEALREMERAAGIFPYSALPKMEIEAIHQRDNP